MDPELKSLLKENLRVAEDTNRILRSMRRQARWGLVGKVILWIVLIIVPLFFLKAYLEPYMELLQGAQGGNTGGYDIQKLLQQYQAGQ